MIKPLDELKNDPKLKWIYDKAKTVSQFSDKNVIFAVAPHIYSNALFGPHLLAHETCHIVQQGKVGLEQWWNQWFDDLDFRYEQELEAHRIEYIALKACDRDTRRRGLKDIVNRMNSPVYGMGRITTKEDITL